MGALFPPLNLGSSSWPALSGACDRRPRRLRCAADQDLRRPARAQLAEHRSGAGAQLASLLVAVTGKWAAQPRHAHEHVLKLLRDLPTKIRAVWKSLGLPNW